MARIYGFASVWFNLVNSIGMFAFGVVDRLLSHELTYMVVAAAILYWILFV